MKLYVSGDMEGVAGVCSWQQVDARTPHPQYAIFQRSYTREIAAAIAGARAAGAGDVLVNDAHGPMRNLLFDELPDDIRVVFGNRKPLSMVQNAQGFDGAFFIGYHGAIGDADAVLCHTYTPSVVHNVWLSGLRCSEATINAALLGSFGVPLLLVSGDRTTVEGVQTQMPWVRGAIVKESIGNFAADSLTPGVARELIQREAQLAVEHRNAARPFVIEPPIVLEIELSRVEQADYVAMIPGFERTGPRRIRFAHDDMTVIFKAFAATFRLGNV